MKIEGGKPNFDPSLARIGEKRSTGAPAGDSLRTGGDAIHVSAEAQLVKQAIEVASKAPEIRAELVERAKELRDAGVLGADAYALADVLIKSALES